jgi:hypothetical protein
VYRSLWRPSHSSAKTHNSLLIVTFDEDNSLSLNHIYTTFVGAGVKTGIGAAIVADRAGKGLRTAPRDAMITLSMPEEGLGRAFGVQRAMDSAGAFAGPLVAIGVLAASGQAFDAVFVVSGCVAAIGLLVLVLFVWPAGCRRR